ncbi:MAG: hypothetical protein ACOC9D_04305 [Thermodesulfobacteriota bacterium]
MYPPSTAVGSRPPLPRTSPRQPDLARRRSLSSSTAAPPGVLTHGPGSRSPGSIRHDPAAA